MTVTSVSPYFSNTVAWTSWFRTIAGLRADYVDMDVASDNPVNSGKAHDFLWSPKLSLVFGPWSRTEYFANIGRGFHSNDARGTTITIDPKTGAAADRVAPLVQTFGYEGGVRSELAKGLTASAALWKLRQDSELLFVGDAGTTEPSRPSERYGLELLTQYLPKPGLALDLSLAYTHARFRDDDPAGNYIPGAPRSRGVGGRHGGKRLRLVRRAALALLRSATLDRGQQRAVEIDLARQRARRLRVQQDVQAPARCLQPVRPQGPRHRLLLRVAARRASRRRWRTFISTRWRSGRCGRR